MYILPLAVLTFRSFNVNTLTPAGYLATETGHPGSY
jgi:hypothetical protein